jgi:tetratricopeptide (TPR) repeat protein
VLLVEVEQKTLEGYLDEAEKLIEKASRSNNYDEFIIVNLRAMIVTHQALSAMASSDGNQLTMMSVKSLFDEVSCLYTKALELDPESLEVKAQFASLKSMMFGDLNGAIELLKDALSMARSRDEVFDLLTVSLYSCFLLFCSLFSSRCCYSSIDVS